MISYWSVHTYARMQWVKWMWMDGATKKEQKERRRRIQLH
jgi:hypothetical protein